jgi:hypothetical protein
MSESKSKKLSVFALAKRVGSVTVEITAEDVLQLRPDWSLERACAFLEQQSRDVADAMVMAAMATLIAATRSGGVNVQ